MKRREMKLLLEERFERIALLETRIDTMDQLVEGYRAREQSVLDALQAAKVTAAKALEQAQAEGAQIRAEAQKTLAEAEQARINARAEAEALLSDAISAANTLKAEAERRAFEETAGVRADSERMLRDAEIIKREYEEMVDSFNAMLAQNASELETTAARFAEFVKNRKIDRAEARLDGNAFYKSVGEMNDAALPDASEDPALLMQNIYRIQNRPLPEDRLDAGVQDEQQVKEEAASTATEPALAVEPQQTEAAGAPEFPMQDGNGADERQSTVEPYSEAAWRNEAHESESEPQAEFTKSFDNAYVKSDYTIHDDECSVTQADVESEFDAMMAGGASLAGAAAVDIPTTAALVSEKLAPEPMADAARAFDAYFDETFEPAGKTAQDEIPAEQVTEPQGAAPQPEPAPEYVSDAEAEEILKSFPEAGSAEATQAAATPEPYSARAWEHESFTSELEPQAEGTLFGEQELEQRVPTQTVSEPSATNDAEQAFDDYLAGIGVYTPSAPAQIAKPVEPETTPAPEPYSARAWEHESFTSELEPQAEGTLFGGQEIEPPTPTQVYSEYEKQPSTSNDAERAFDDYLAGIGVYTPSAPAPVAKPVEPETTPAPEPYSARAWERESFTSELEPQAEGALFGEREAEPTQPASASDTYDHQPASSNDAERAFDDYLTNINSIMAPSQPATPTVDTSWSYEEPYREEPSQAQTAAYEAPAEEEEEEEPKPAPRRYNEYGEIREWEPEPEPDMGDIPTVSRFVGQSGGEEEISLDDLLDEIIKAGD